MQRIKLHNCENCNIDFDYENQLRIINRKSNLFKRLENKVIICPSCGCYFNFVYNELNDFTYLEFIGFYQHDEIIPSDFNNKNSFLCN